ncbi:CRK1 protein-like [Oryza sativa Japonica Group]|uniref:CRK1 protein-like n=1 Tax=Oryza sativa subsp. japonica TaxID=39947 RepID=Q5ZC39_ORYSJ|nr:CRK1 protein-like [Oryza sativa Japonica Group]
MAGLFDLRELSDRLLTARLEFRERQEHLATRRSLLSRRRRRAPLPPVPPAPPLASCRPRMATPRRGRQDHAPRLVAPGTALLMQTDLASFGFRFVAFLLVHGHARKAAAYLFAPLACDPTSLPKLPPSKEYNAKLRGKEAIRQNTTAIGGKGSMSVKPGRNEPSKAAPAQDAIGGGDHQRVSGAPEEREPPLQLAAPLTLRRAWREEREMNRGEMGRGGGGRKGMRMTSDSRATSSRRKSRRRQQLPWWRRGGDARDGEDEGGGWAKREREAVAHQIWRRPATSTGGGTAAPSSSSSSAGQSRSAVPSSSAGAAPATAGPMPASAGAAKRERGLEPTMGEREGERRGAGDGRSEASSRRRRRSAPRLLGGCHTR